MALARLVSCSSLPPSTARFSVHSFYSISASFVMYALFVCSMMTSDAWVFIVDSVSESVLAVLTALLVWASASFVIALMVSSATTLVPSASTLCFTYVGPTALFVQVSALFVVALMMLSTTTLVPSVSTHPFPDVDLMELFVQMSLCW